MTLVTLSPADFFALDDFMYFQQDRLDDTVTEQEINSIIDITAMPGKLHILDTPCGYGRHSKALMQRGHQVTGIDLSPRFIDQAQTYPLVSKEPLFSAKWIPRSVRRYLIWC